MLILTTFSEIMSNVLWTILGAIVFCLVLGVIVLIHEGGHFFFARRAGVLCHEFSIGMGPVLFQKKKGETVYSIRAIPIGGFVSMAGEEVEFDVLQNNKQIRIVVENNRVVKIICNLNNSKYQDLPIYDIISYDLSGTLEAKKDELYLTLRKENESEEVTYIVDRCALINLEKQQELQIAPADRNLVNKSLGKRFITVFGGPMMNFVLAVVIFFIMGVVQGYPNTNATIVDKVDEYYPAYTIGLEEGDTIKSINGFETKKWNDIGTILDQLATGKDSNGNAFEGILTIEYYDKSEDTTVTKTLVPQTYLYNVEILLKHDENDPLNTYVAVYGDEATNTKTKAYLAGIRPGDKIINVDKNVINNRNDLLAYFTGNHLEDKKQVSITVLRETNEFTYDVDINSDEMLLSQGVTPVKMQMGISPEYSFNFVKLLYMPWVETGQGCLTIFKTLGLLFTDSTVNLGDLSGPIGIFTLLKEQTKQGIMNILYWTATLSVNIGLVNLLPLPALDGGRLAFLLYEAITRKKVNAKVENIIHSIGLILLMGLFVFISFNDILRCFK